MNEEWLERRTKKREDVNPTNTVPRPKSNWAQIAQSLLTLSTLLFAVYVFSSWRHQEFAKRRADLALQILKDVENADRCFQDAFPKEGVEGPDPSPHYDAKTAKSSIDEVLKGLKRCRPGFTALSVAVPLSRQLLGEDAFAATESFEQIIRTTVSHYQVALETVVLQGDRPPADSKRFVINTLRDMQKSMVTYDSDGIHIIENAQSPAVQAEHAKTKAITHLMRIISLSP